ncbi:DUF1667 domain-containing protein [Eubacteriales bacterium OttesenSCG-928-M02]|nr:DUF1667 domain-containing protein [Eubacteriales bacterium OttesenSCG-928-M02]
MDGTRRMTCIVCPIGCTIAVKRNRRGEMVITGNKCPRGLAYAKEEMTDPRRNITSLVRVAGQREPYGVKTAAPIKKGEIAALMEALGQLEVSPDAKAGDVVLKRFGEVGVDVIITRGGESALSSGLDMVE